MAFNPEINIASLRQGWSWVRQGLASSLPLGLHEAFLRPLPRLIVDVSGDMVVFTYRLGREAFVVDRADPTELESGNQETVLETRSVGGLESVGTGLSSLRPL